MKDNQAVCIKQQGRHHANSYNYVVLYQQFTVQSTDPSCTDQT